MTNANECTCPSGDGSLRHPCPAHPAVEKSGGDERAAFELFVRKHCGMPEHIAVNWDAKFTNDAWEGWKARAALAKPSPAQAEQAGRDVEPAPCPFCGGEVDPTGWLRGDGTRGPECNYCGATARSMEAWQTRAALSHAPTSSASPSCKWTESSGIWETGCGQTWSFIEDGPAENGALFCHHCGGRLVLIKSDDQEDDGEPCPECMEHGCNGECAGHGAMGD
ncbi:TPA: hypothetical protein ACRL4E_002185 [Pseudomonas aeruginosa]|nr:hypothetical protein [Pseudomonas aeruginosa]MDG3799803.1 hypothetical protein [Pseudomonas aeruginosa]HBN8472980.1 hypothetical protein [Pseudomonas aeruginosa]HBO6324607.1 hypothetical protein [Pseudomonas aeruginosa]HCH7472645.1 hypothetical protein [Pseudomonas aeruginosa]